MGPNPEGIRKVRTATYLRAFLRNLFRWVIRPRLNLSYKVIFFLQSLSALDLMGSSPLRPTRTDESSGIRMSTSGNLDPRTRILETGHQKIPTKFPPELPITRLSPSDFCLTEANSESRQGIKNNVNGSEQSLYYVLANRHRRDVSIFRCDSVHENHHRYFKYDQ